MPRELKSNHIFVIFKLAEISNSRNQGNAIQGEEGFSAEIIAKSAHEPIKHSKLETARTAR